MPVFVILNPLPHTAHLYASPSTHLTHMGILHNWQYPLLFKLVPTPHAHSPDPVIPAIGSAHILHTLYYYDTHEAHPSTKHTAQFPLLLGLSSADHVHAHWPYLSMPVYSKSMHYWHVDGLSIEHLLHPIT